MRNKNSFRLPKETKAAASAVPLFLPPRERPLIPSSGYPDKWRHGNGCLPIQPTQGICPPSVDGSGRILLLSWSPPRTLRRLSGHLVSAFASHHCLIYVFFTIIHSWKKLSSIF